MAAVSSSLKAARSSPDRNLISVSTDSVANRLSSSCNRRRSPLTSRMTRAASAMRVSGREAIRTPSGIAGDRAEGCRRDDVGGGCGDEQTLGKAPPLAALGDTHQAMCLERPQVVVDLLTGNPRPGGQRGCRRRLGQFREQPAAHGLERNGCRCRIFDDLDVDHAPFQH